MARFLCVLLGLSLWTVSSAAESKRPPLFVVGQSASVRAGEEVESAIVIGGDLEVAGKVRGLAAAVGGDLRVGPAAAIGGPAAAIGGELSIDAAARIDGPKVHAAAGDFSKIATQLSDSEKSRPPPFWLGSALRVFQILATFVLGILLVVWAPKQVRAVRDALLTDPTRDLLLGLVVLMGLVPFCVLLAVSILGIPLIPLVVLFGLACFVFGLVGVAAVVGRRLRAHDDDEHLLGTVALGMLALALGAALPVLGVLIMLTACVYGAGAVLTTRFGTKTPGPRSDTKSTPTTASGTSLGASP